MPQHVGWTLREAIRRTVDPDLLKQCVSAEREWRKASAPRRFVRSFGLVHDDQSDEAAPHRRLQNLRNAQLSAAEAVNEAFRPYLISGQLVAHGRRGSPLAEIVPIPPSTWKVLKIKDIKRSIVAEPVPNKTAIYAVRIIPALHADDIVDRLDNVPLVRAFDLFVFNDPHVSSLRKKAVARGGEPRTVGFQSRLYHAYWYVDHGTVSSDDPTGFLLDGDYRSASRFAEQAMQDRFRRIVKLLIDGAIIAEGALFGQGALTEVSRAMWLRKTAVLDLYQGDFYDRYPDPGGDGEDRVHPLYLGLMLRRPKAEPPEKLHVKPIEHDLVPQTSSGPASSARHPVESKAARKVELRAQARRECSEWLAAEMRKSPGKRPFPKPHWREQAATRWGALLSYRAFDDAWDEAIAKTGAFTWAAAGAPKRSPQ
jgi:hypothetical protein